MSSEEFVSHKKAQKAQKKLDTDEHRLRGFFVGREKASILRSRTSTEDGQRHEVRSQKTEVRSQNLV